MLDFGQEKRAKSGSRGSEAAVQSPTARNFTNLVQNYTMYIYNVTRIYRISQIYFSYDDSFIVGRILKMHFRSSSNNQTGFISE